MYLHEKSFRVFGFGFYFTIMPVFGFGFASRGFVPTSDKNYFEPQNHAHF